MRKLDHVWTQACIDIDLVDVEPPTLERYDRVVGYIAQMLKDAGADIVEVGTPVCYALGYNGVKRIRRCVGDDIKVAADMKAQDGASFFFPCCAPFGADYCSVSVVNNPGGFHGAQLAKKEHGIKFIADLYAVPVDQLVSTAVKCSAGGADIVCLNLGHDDKAHNVYPGRRESDYVKEIAQAIDAPLFVVANSPEEAERAIADGADGIVFGEMIKDASIRSFKTVKDYIDLVHELDVKYNG